MRKVALGCLVLFGMIQIINAATRDKVVDTSAFAWKKWHVYTITYTGPTCQENATGGNNPFTDYRFSIVAHQEESGGETYPIPGYFAADGHADSTGATSGNKWKVHFMNQWPGIFTCTVHFRHGLNIAGSADPNAGTPVVAANGDTLDLDTFIINDHDVAALKDNDNTSNSLFPDFRFYGKTGYNLSCSKHIITAASAGRITPCLLFGLSSPSNFLACSDIDSTTGNASLLKTYPSHVADWVTGDPTWTASQKGKGIIGAINYLSSKGVNALAVSTLDVGGPDGNIYPWRNATDHVHYSCSKLDQWKIIFDHAQQKGIFLTFKLFQGANQSLLTGDSTLWRVYCRELIARYAQFCGIGWSLGDDITLTTAQQKTILNYLHTMDPFGFGAAGTRCFGTGVPSGQESTLYGPLLGDTTLTNPSYGTINTISLETGIKNIHATTLSWVKKSDSVTMPHYTPWIVTCGTQLPKDSALPPDSGYTGYNNSGTYPQDSIRKYVLWGNIMAGGSGINYTFASNQVQPDSACQDFRSREHMYLYNKYASKFFSTYLTDPGTMYMLSLTNCDSVLSNKNDYCLGFLADTWDSTGHVYYQTAPYVVYLPNGGTTNISISPYTIDTLRVWWYNPRTGGLTGTADSIMLKGGVVIPPGGAMTSIGNPPADPTKDWVALIISTSAGYPSYSGILASVIKEKSVHFAVQNLVTRNGMIRMAMPDVFKVSGTIEIMRYDGRVVTSFAAPRAGALLKYRCPSRGIFLVFNKVNGVRTIIARVTNM